MYDGIEMTTSNSLSRCRATDILLPEYNAIRYMFKLPRNKIIENNYVNIVIHQLAHYM